MKALSQSEVVLILKKEQGKRSLREFAKDLGISAAYLCQIYTNTSEPGPAVLSKIGVRRRIVYEVAR